MIVAGLGSRNGVAADAVLDALRAAAEEYGVRLDRIGLLATGETKAAEPAFGEAAVHLGIPLEIVGTALLRQQSVETESAASRAATGTGSLAEAAALAAAGAGARLLGPRAVHGPVTCALAESAS